MREERGSVSGHNSRITRIYIESLVILVKARLGYTRLVVMEGGEASRVRQS